MGSRSQYEVLGIDAKRDMPIRDDRDVWLLAFLMPFTGNLDRPIRDGSLIKTLTQHFALGYFRQVPPGQLLLAHVFSRYVDADGRLPDARRAHPPRRMLVAPPTRSVAGGSRLEKQPTDLRRRHDYMPFRIMCRIVQFFGLPCEHQNPLATSKPAN